MERHCIRCHNSDVATQPGPTHAPFCEDCLEWVGTEIIIGKRVWCRMAGYIGIVLQFDGADWNGSTLAEVQIGPDKNAWLPLAELIPE